MAKCNHFGQVEKDGHLSMAYFCEQFGWPELLGLCPDHFREHYVVPAQINEYESARLVSILQHRLYLVEVAMGLRSLPNPSTVAGDSVSENPHLRNGEGVVPPTPQGARRSRPSLTQRTVEDLEEME